MPNVQRMSDSNDAGGSITTIPQSKFFVESLLVCVNGSKGTSHPPCPTVSTHCAGNWQTSGGSTKFLVQGIPVNYTGNLDTCGHTRVGGSTKFFLTP